MRDKDEITFLRLINKTKGLEEGSWRKRSYIETLQEMHLSISKCSNVSSDDKVQYERDMTALCKGLEEEAAPTPDTPSPISELIHRRRATVEEAQRLKTPHKSAPAPQRSPSPLQAAEEEEPDIEEVLRVHRAQQSKLADEMLLMTRELKNISTVARDIIIKDNSGLSSMADQADTNFAKLQKETSALEKLNESSGKCWVWFLIFLVCVIFIVMVLFIRLFPK